MSIQAQPGLFSLDDLTEDGGTLPGFRLHRLELLNWGTFNKNVRTFRLDGENSLLTGDIGSGKSTVVDAITTLLLPANKIEYNKAAGAQKKERSLMSYVRGFHKSARSGIGDASRPVALRGPGTFTVVLGVFHNAALDKSITLAITLWATQEAGQPTRFYSIAEGEQSHQGRLLRLRHRPGQAEAAAAGTTASPSSTCLKSTPPRSSGTSASAPPRPWTCSTARCP